MDFRLEPYTRLSFLPQLNVLYWHITDSQSFPLHVERFPELAQKGAYSEDEIYSTDDVKQIISYANSVSRFSFNVW